jgi:hypothetical protein
MLDTDRTAMSDRAARVGAAAGGVYELKIDFGPGYRVYYLQPTDELIHTAARRLSGYSTFYRVSVTSLSIRGHTVSRQVIAHSSCER